MSRYNSLLFIFECFHDEQHTQWRFFFFFFRQASSNLRDSFRMVFSQSSSIFHRAVHQPIAYFQVSSSRGGSNRSLKNYGFLCDAIFFFTCTHVHKSLSNEM